MYHARNDVMKDTSFYENIPYRYAGIIKDDVNNGKGIGLTLFVQYCPHRCRNCQNVHTWSMYGGFIFTEEILEKIIDYFKKHRYAKRFTLSGGDPLANPLMTNWIIKRVKKACPWLHIWLYTGYVYEDIQNEKIYKNIFPYLDVLIDGPYEDELRDITLAFRGSSNQRIIDMKKTLEENHVITMNLEEKV